MSGQPYPIDNSLILPQKGVLLKLILVLLVKLQRGQQEYFLQKGSPFSHEGTQILEKLCELQKFVEPLKNIGGNINRLNNLITLCNRRLDALDQKISEHEGKRKEPPGSEHNPLKKPSAKDGTTQIYLCFYAQLGALTIALVGRQPNFLYVFCFCSCLVINIASTLCLDVFLSFNQCLCQVEPIG